MANPKTGVGHGKAAVATSLRFQGPTGVQPKKTGVLLWSFVQGPDGAAEQGQTLHAGPTFDKLPDPFPFTPAKKGQHHVVLLAWDMDNPPAGVNDLAHDVVSFKVL